MTERTFVISPRDPVIFRDGKPFTAGLPARSVSFPNPSAVIGAIRTRLGLHTRFEEPVRNSLLEMRHIGPFLALPGKDGRWELAFPAPLDAVAFDGKDSRELDIYPLRPHSEAAGEGTDLKGLLLLTNALPESKPSEKAPVFWRAEFTAEWLSYEQEAPLRRDAARIGVRALPRSQRMHVAIDGQTQTARDQMLFATEGLEFREGIGRRDLGMDLRSVEAEDRAICSLVRYEAGSWSRPEALAPLGGERRLAFWDESPVSWPRPVAIHGDRVRLQLVTPAFFKNGWKPAWIGDDFIGSPPGKPAMRMRLVAAAVGRPMPVSGWDYVTNQPKPTRMLAPAGSVYFFERAAGVAREDWKPASLWMEPVSDGDQNRLDGFGIAICGGW